MHMKIWRKVQWGVLVLVFKFHCPRFPTSFRRSRLLDKKAASVQFAIQKQQIPLGMGPLGR